MRERQGKVNELSAKIETLNGVLSAKETVISALKDSEASLKLKIKHLEDEIRRLTTASGNAASQETTIIELRGKLSAAQERFAEMQDKCAALGKEKNTLEREMSVVFVKLEDTDRELLRLKGLQ